MGLGLLYYQGLLEDVGKCLVAGAACDCTELHLTALPGASTKKGIKKGGETKNTFSQSGCLWKK